MIKDFINRNKDLIKSNIVNSFLLQKAKASIGEVRVWGGDKYRKVAEGEWVKIVETKQGEKEKPVSQSGMKKVIDSEINKHYQEFQSVVSDFEKTWRENNPEANQAFIQFRVKLDRAKSESISIQEAREKYREISDDLRDDLSEILKLKEILAKKKREEASGKKEISINDDYFKSNFDKFTEIKKDWESLERTVTAKEALGEEVTADDYWLNTDTLFTKLYDYNDNKDDVYDQETKIWTDPVEKKWNQLQDENPELELTHSPKSSSQYLVDRKEQKVYRMADHWGRCASCEWDFDGKHHYGIGVSNLSNFKRNDGFGWVNQKRVKKNIDGVKKILSGLRKMVKNDKVYFDKQATEKIKTLSNTLINELKWQVRVDESELKKIQKQYKEVFEI